MTEGAFDRAGDPTTAPSWLGISVAFLLDEGTMLILGSTDRPMPKSGIAEFPDGKAGRFRSISWNPAGQGASRVVWSLVVLRVENIAQVRAAQITLVPDGSAVPVRMPSMPRLELEPTGLFERLKAEDGEYIPPLLDFLRASLDRSGAGLSGRSARFLFAFLHALSRPDGFLETLGVLDGGGLMLQGWAFHLFAGEPRIIIETNRCAYHDASVATFSRSDVPASARGVLLVVNEGGSIEPAQIRRAYFQTDSGLFHLDTFENRTVLANAEADAHLRSLLPSLESEKSVRHRLKQICNVRYEGRETVSSLSVPVRSSLDLAVAVPGVGVLLTGWVLDPLGLVQRVALKSRRGKVGRVDSNWHRMARADVTRGYRQEPAFAPLLRPGDDLHGYVVLVRWEGDTSKEEELYLEFALADDEFAFMPVQARVPQSASVVRQILSSFSISDPLADKLISEHIGPAVSGILAGLPAGGKAVTIHRLGRHKSKAQLTAIIPVLSADAAIDVNFARFASDLDFERVELVVVMPATVAEAMGPGVRRYAEFYDLSVRLMIVGAPLDRYEAIEIGANAAETNVLLFITPDVIPTKRGWLSALARRLSQVSDAGLITPTLIYEDHSIKYAGMERGEGNLLTSNLVGYARHWLTSDQARAVDAATMECCVLTRQAFAAAGGFPKDYVHADLKGIDLSIKIREAGFRCLWAPDVQLYAVDEAKSEENEYWAQTGRLVDRWGFARKWARAATGPDLHH